MRRGGFVEDEEAPNECRRASLLQELRNPPITSQAAHCYNLGVTPTVFRKDGYRFFFFSREEERPHVHVVSGEGEAKFWLRPEIRLARSYHLSQKQLRQIATLVEEYEIELIRAWQRHFES